MSSITVTHNVIAALKAEADNAAPLECCGLLLGRGGTIDEARAADNVSDQPESRFEIDPVALLRAHKEARNGGRQLLGYYHSHPAGHPLPSATDCEHASGDGRVWAIVAGDEVTFWRDKGDAFDPLDIALVDD